MSEEMMGSANGAPVGPSVGSGSTNGNGTVAEPELRAAQAEMRALTADIMLDRMRWARQAGLTFGDARDMYAVLGYARTLTVDDFRSRYERGGIAGRIVDVFPNATWRGSFEIIEDQDPEKITAFEQAWIDLDTRLQVQAKLMRVDKLAGQSTYAVLLIGARGEDGLVSELPRGNGTAADLIYLTPFSGAGGPAIGGQYRSVVGNADATIESYDTDVRSPRFGLPLIYNLKRTSLEMGALTVVHWSRIIHVAENLIDNDVFGSPRLERVWNLLDDLDKVTGGGAEAFWLRANQGMHVDVDKDMSLEATKDTIAALKDQAELYKHQQTRWLRTRGVKVSTLGSDVANFDNPADAIITQIAGALGVPKRILTGSEMGELASSQDRENWRDQVNGRQTGYAGPYIVRALVDRLVSYNYLPTPVGGPLAYEVRWAQVTTMTEQEKVAGANGWASVNQAQGETVFTSDEIREKWAGKAPLTPEQKAEEEAKRAARQPALPFGDVPPEDQELLRVMQAAIRAGNTAVVDEIVGLQR